MQLMAEMGQLGLGLGLGLGSGLGFGLGLACCGESRFWSSRYGGDMGEIWRRYRRAGLLRREQVLVEELRDRGAALPLHLVARHLAVEVHGGPVLGVPG